MFILFVTVTSNHLSIQLENNHLVNETRLCVVHRQRLLPPSSLHHAVAVGLIRFRLAADHLRLSVCGVLSRQVQAEARRLSVLVQQEGELVRRSGAVLSRSEGRAGPRQQRHCSERKEPRSRTLLHRSDGFAARETDE